MKLIRESAGDVKLAKFIIFVTEDNYGYKKDFYPELPGFIFAETYIWNSRTKDDSESLEHKDIKRPYELAIKMFQLGVGLSGAVGYYKGKKCMDYYPSAEKGLSSEQKELVKDLMQKLVGRIEE